MTVHLALHLNWLMGGGGIAVVLGAVLGFLGFGLIDSSDWAGTLGGAGTVLIAGGFIAFFVGLGAAL